MNYDQYLSPLTWRYSSTELRTIWSESNKRKLWRKMWATLAEVQMEFGIVTPEQLEDLKNHVDDIDIEQSMLYESEIHHDLMAEIKTFSKQCDIGKGIIHLGATSMDIEDNVDVIRIKESLDYIEKKLSAVLFSFSQQISKWADTPIMSFTHLQPAEPTTLGYRLAFYAQDLLDDYNELQTCKNRIKGKGFKGAVGTGASYIELIGKENFDQFDKRLSEIIGIPFYKVTTQVYPRKQDLTVINLLSAIAASLYKFAMDVRILQSPPIGELSEPFGEKQVGSSAMPFKRNPIRSEKINSLARYLGNTPTIAWQNASLSMLERTLDDSANRRKILPESFLICDELLMATEKIISQININKEAIDKNFQTYAPFAATERLLMALVKSGADRQEMHHIIREQSMLAWQAIQNGKPNPLISNLNSYSVLKKYLTEKQIQQCLEINNYLGIAPINARQISQIILNTLGKQ